MVNPSYEDVVYGNSHIQNHVGTRPIYVGYQFPQRPSIDLQSFSISVNQCQCSFNFKGGSCQPSKDACRQRNKIKIQVPIPGTGTLQRLIRRVSPCRKGSTLASPRQRFPSATISQDPGS